MTVLIAPRFGTGKLVLCGDERKQPFIVKNTSGGGRRMTNLRVALLSSCTIELLERPFSAALGLRGFSPEIWTGGFGQYRQEILDERSSLYAHAPDAVVLYLDGEDLFQEMLRNPFVLDPDARINQAAERAAEVESVVATLVQRLPESNDHPQHGVRASRQRAHRP
jgi:predicted enzyme involved in methoxymalonyl-ACP biosynthesis